jgi:hypothetical protein
MSEVELELALKHQEREITKIKAQLELLMPKTEEVWMSPVKAAQLSNGLYSVDVIRAIVDRAISDPLETKLVDGIHYKRTLRGKNHYYRINWEKFAAAI